MLMVLIKEIITAQCVGHMHIDHLPWRQHCLFIREMESRDNSCDFYDTLLDGQFIRLFRHFDDFGSAGYQHIYRNKVRQLPEHLLGELGRHKLVPRFLVDDIFAQQVVNGQTYWIRDRSKQQQWQSNKNIVQDTL